MFARNMVTSLPFFQQIPPCIWFKTFPVRVRTKNVDYDDLHGAHITATSPSKVVDIKNMSSTRPIVPHNLVQSETRYSYA